MKPVAHKIATRAVGGTVAITIIRDPADGESRFAVTYDSRAERWTSRHRFHEMSQAESGALTLADFLGAEFRA